MTLLSTSAKALLDMRRKVTFEYDSSHLFYANPKIRTLQQILILNVNKTFSCLSEGKIKQKISRSTVVSTLTPLEKRRKHKNVIFVKVFARLFRFFIFPSSSQKWNELLSFIIRLPLLPFLAVWGFLGLPLGKHSRFWWGSCLMKSESLPCPARSISLVPL